MEKRKFVVFDCENDDDSLEDYNFSLSSQSGTDGESKVKNNNKPDSTHLRVNYMLIREFWWEIVILKRKKKHWKSINHELFVRSEEYFSKVLGAGKL